MQDYAVVVVGDNSMRYKWKDKTAGENMGRANLDLFGKQLELVQAIEKTGTPVIIVLVNGKPISEPWLEKKYSCYYRILGTRKFRRASSG